MSELLFPPVLGLPFLKVLFLCPPHTPRACQPTSPSLCLPQTFPFWSPLYFGSAWGVEVASPRVSEALLIPSPSECRPSSPRAASTATRWMSRPWRGPPAGAPALLCPTPFAPPFDSEPLTTACPGRCLPCLQRAYSQPLPSPPR